MRFLPASLIETFYCMVACVVHTHTHTGRFCSTLCPLLRFGSHLNPLPREVKGTVSFSVVDSSVETVAPVSTARQRFDTSRSGLPAESDCETRGDWRAHRRDSRFVAVWIFARSWCVCACSDCMCVCCYVHILDKLFSSTLRTLIIGCLCLSC